MSSDTDGPVEHPGAEESDVEKTSTISVRGIEVDTEEMSTDDVAAVEGLPEGSALLLVLRGPGAGARFLLDSETVTVGRHPDSDIFLDDITVSRRHATFARVDAGYQVSDLGSLNGTYVNRDRIDGDIALSNGDEVQIGKYRLIYVASVGGASV